MEDLEIVQEFLSKKNLDGIDKFLLEKYFKAIENLVKKLNEYKHGMIMISEICIDESKCHITSEDAIKEVRKYIVH